MVGVDETDKGLGKYLTTPSLKEILTVILYVVVVHKLSDNMLTSFGKGEGQEGHLIYSGS